MISLPSAAAQRNHNRLTGAVPVDYRSRMARTRTLFNALTRHGPHRVLRGDLAFAGIPGVLYTPASGFHLPGVAFGHDWLSDSENYIGTLEHLASWGIVAAAPDTQRGFVPSVLTLAHDLTATLDVICGVRLGPGKISVAPEKLGLAGHGFGAAAAVLAAESSGAKAVAAVFPAVTKPSAEAVAGRLTVPGLVLATADDAKSLRTDALEVAANWDGAVLRVVKKANVRSLVEKHRMPRLRNLLSSDGDTKQAVRALLTGFLLYHLTGDETYKEFADPETGLPETRRPDPDAPPLTDEDRIVALFR